MIEIQDDGIYFCYDKSEIYKQPSFSSHCHNHYEFYLFLSGDVVYTVEDAAFDILPFDALLIKPLEYHFPTFLSNKTYERQYIYFDESFIPDNLKDFVKTAPLFFRPAAGNKLIKTLLNFTEKIKRYDESDVKLALRALPCEILLELKYSRYEQSVESYERNFVVSDAVRYINDNISEPLSVPVIAEALRISPSRLSHIFNECFPTSIMSYVRHKRILFAESLIESGHKPAKAARLSGFENYSTFYRAYKQLLNKAPTE